jgi:hypothetical protein
VRLLLLNSTTALLVGSIWRPFRAHRSGSEFPALKPWAEASSPFGQKSSVAMEAARRNSKDLTDDTLDCFPECESDVSKSPIGGSRTNGNGSTG